MSSSPEKTDTAKVSQEAKDIIKQEGPYIDPKDQILSKSFINKYDCYSIKGALDDEIVNVSSFAFDNKYKLNIFFKNRND